MQNTVLVPAVDVSKNLSQCKLKAFFPLHTHDTHQLVNHKRRCSLTPVLAPFAVTPITNKFKGIILLPNCFKATRFWPHQHKCCSENTTGFKANLHLSPAPIALLSLAIPDSTSYAGFSAHGNTLRAKKAIEICPTAISHRQLEYFNFFVFPFSPLIAIIKYF